MSSGNAHHIGSHNFNGPQNMIYVRAEPQLSVSVISRAPQAAVALDKQTVRIPRGNGRDASVDKLCWARDSGVFSAIPQWAIAIPAKAPHTAVVLQE